MVFMALFDPMWCDPCSNYVYISSGKGSQGTLHPWGCNEEKTGLLYLFHDHSRLATDLTNMTGWGELYDGWEKDIPPPYEHRGPSLAEEAQV